MTEPMQELQAHAEQVTRARAAETRAQAAESLSTALRAQLEIAEDTIDKISVERDYFRAFSADLAARASVIEEAVKGMIEKAAVIAKLQLVDVQKHEAVVAEQVKAQDARRREPPVQRGDDEKVTRLTDTPEYIRGQHR